MKFNCPRWPVSSKAEAVKTLTSQVDDEIRPYELTTNEFEHRTQKEP
jgi:hypothetical protein